MNNINHSYKMIFIVKICLNIGGILNTKSYLFNSMAAKITGATPFWSLSICFSEM